MVPKQADLDKVRSTLKQFVREWSEEGKAERDACFQPLIDEIDALFPHPAMYAHQPALWRLCLSCAVLY